MKNHGCDKYATKNKYDKIAQNFRTLLECSSACLSAGATCLAFSFESEECELGGDPGESPTQPSGTPTLPSFATKLVDGQKAVYAKKWVCITEKNVYKHICKLIFFQHPYCNHLTYPPAPNCESLTGCSWRTRP